MRVRTGRVRDQVAVTQTRQALSPRLQGACLTEKREGGKEIGRQRDYKIDRKKAQEHQEKESRGGKVSKQTP